MIKPSHLDLTKCSITSLISGAKQALIDRNVSGPYCVYLSHLANKALLRELEERDGKKHSMVFEIFGMQVKIDPDCPSQGAYVIGEKT